MILIAPPLAAIIWPDSPARFYSKNNTGSSYAACRRQAALTQVKTLKDVEP
jgi:hypothetical protein